MAVFSNPQRLLSVTGVNVFVGDIIREVTQIPDRLDRLAFEYALRIQRDAQKRAPYDPNRRAPGPHLRDTITVDRLDKGVYVIGPEARYGHIVEFGSVRQAPQPYMLPALDRNVPRFQRALLKIVGEF